MTDKNKTPQGELKVSIGGYLSLLIAIIVFSGVFAKQAGWLSAFDFTTLNGSFGTIKELGKQTFMGAGGLGAKDGFLFALNLLPAVMLALGIVEVVEHYGGLRAAQKIMTPLLRPLLGIPGIAGLALVTSLQSTDAGAAMTKNLYDEKMLSEKEWLIFSMFQFSCGGMITNYLSTGAALFAFLLVPIGWPLVVLFVMKIFGANVLRLYLNYALKKEAAKQ